MPPYANILVIQTAFIGDAILASSLLEKLHTRFPLSHISILVRQGNESIYNNHPFLKEVLVWNKQKHKLKNLFILLKLVRSKHYDCVVNCHRYASSGFITGFSGAKHSTGFKQNMFSFLFNSTVKHVIGNGRHEIERYNDLVKDFAGDELFKPRLYPSQSDIEKIKPHQSEPYVCMAPASVWFTKQLPEKKWVELCNTQAASKAIFLLGSAGDRELCERIKTQAQHQNITVLAGMLSLLQSCALMQQAHMNYVNDSAPLHLASSVNAPVTAFFVSTIPQFGFGPLSDVAVIKQADEHLTCRPCGLHGFKSCPKNHFKCGKMIRVN